jgi:FkbM family methyltransferase
MSERIEPFGTFSFSRLRLACRDFAGVTRPPGLGLRRLRYSVLRRAAYWGWRGRPVDATPFDGVRARLHIWDNATDLWVHQSAERWDAVERARLASALAAKPDGEPFSFVDVGANSGLYIIWMVSEARRQGKPLRILAIEPDAENRRRLDFNLAASSAQDLVVVEPVAVSDRPETVEVVVHPEDRGKTQVTAGTGATAVVAEPLVDVLKRQGIDQPDAMKIDIEGDEPKVLAAYFRDAPQAAWPKLLVVEAYPATRARIVDLVEANGYEIVASSVANVVCRIGALIEKGS